MNHIERSSAWAKQSAVLLLIVAVAAATNLNSQQESQESRSWGPSDLVVSKTGLSPILDLLSLPKTPSSKKKKRKGDDQTLYSALVGHQIHMA